MDLVYRLMLSASPIVLVCCMILIWIYFDYKSRAKKQNQWRTIAEGIFDYIAYWKYDHIHKYRTGSMVHTTHQETQKMKVTIIYFDDGRTVTLEDRHDMPFPKGTPIRVIENGLGERKIEKAE